VAGLGAGWLSQGHGVGRLASTIGNQRQAWLALPDGPAVVTPVTPDPTTTVAATAPEAVPPRPPDRPSRAANAGAAGQDPAATVEARINTAMALVSYPWRQLGYRILFESAQPGMQGRTSPRRLGTIEIYVRPDVSAGDLAHVIAHEIGHAVDLVYGDDQRRSLWLQLRGVGSQPWFPCNMCDDFSTPAGDFAETFAYWQLHDYSRSRLAPLPTPAQLSQLAQLFGPPGTS
jgi:hypothetical protein